MRKLLVTSLLLLSSAVWAYNFTDVWIQKDVSDAIQSLNVKQQAKQALEDAIFDLSPEYATGDDGELCNSEVTSISFYKVSDSMLKVEFTAEQDYVSSYGCMTGEFKCKLIVNIRDNGTSRSSGSCRNF